MPKKQLPKKQPNNRGKLVFAIFAIFIILAMLAGDILLMMTPAP